MKDSENVEEKERKAVTHKETWSWTDSKGKERKIIRHISFEPVTIEDE